MAASAAFLAMPLFARNVGLKSSTAIWSNSLTSRRARQPEDAADPAADGRDDRVQARARSLRLLAHTARRPLEASLECPVDDIPNLVLHRWRQLVLRDLDRLTDEVGGLDVKRYYLKATLRDAQLLQMLFG